MNVACRKFGCSMVDIEVVVNKVDAVNEASKEDKQNNFKFKNRSKL